MFIVLVHYIQPLSAIEMQLAAHRNFLDQHYAAGHFIASGPQMPRTGGAILVRSMSREALDALLAEDPFQREKIADYHIIEFHPNKFAAGVEALFAAA